MTQPIDLSGQRGDLASTRDEQLKGQSVPMLLDINFGGRSRISSDSAVLPPLNRGVTDPSESPARDKRTANLPELGQVNHARASAMPYAAGIRPPSPLPLLDRSAQDRPSTSRPQGGRRRRRRHWPSSSRPARSRSPPAPSLRRARCMRRAATSWSARTGRTPRIRPSPLPSRTRS